MAIKKLNESAKVVIETPVGKANAMTLNNIVKQGTVYGPPICAASMDRINKIGYSAE